MRLIKIISYPNIVNVEEAFRKWMMHNDIDIIKINFTTSSHEDELWYSIIIFYQTIEEE